MEEWEIGNEEMGTADFSMAALLASKGVNEGVK